MKENKLQTKHFGELDLSQGDGSFAYWKDDEHKLNLRGQEKVVRLSIFEETVTDDNASVVEGMLDNIYKMYEKSREAILEGKESNKLINDFITHHFVECDPLHEIFGVESNDELTVDMFVEKLELIALAINVDKNIGLNCTLDFSISPDYSDQLLVVVFNSQGELVYITHES